MMIQATNCLWVCGPFSKKIPKRKTEYIVPYGRAGAIRYAD
jgi:hypothetical protein